MRKDKYLAIKLRKGGKSYNQISKILKVPKSTLSSWLKNIKLSSEARNKILNRAHKKSTEALIKRNKYQTVLAAERATKIRNQSRKETFELMKNPLFVSGISLYWAEGYKKGAYGSKWKSVDFANSDPEMIKVMMNFFRSFCGINNANIKIQLMAHPNVDIGKALKFWSSLTKIPQSQFIKTCTAISKYSKKRRNNTLTNGTIHIRINNVKFFFKMIGWIDGLKDFLGL